MGVLRCSVHNRGMFRNAVVFNSDLSNWNTAIVTASDDMFLNANNFNCSSNFPDGVWIGTPTDCNN